MSKYQAFYGTDRDPGNKHETKEGLASEILTILTGIEKNATGDMQIVEIEAHMTRDG